MPYSSNNDLPASVRGALPKDAQDIYRKAFNSAFDQYKDPEQRRGDKSREQTAHQVAWAAVKNDFEKGDDEKWHRRS